MKNIILVLAMFFVQNAFAYITAPQKFNSMLAYGTYYGDDCQVKVSKTIFKNTKIRVRSPYGTISYILEKDESYKFIPEDFFAVRKSDTVNARNDSEYLYLSFSKKGTSVLVGETFYEEGILYRKSAECAFN